MTDLAALKAFPGVFVIDSDVVASTFDDGTDTWLLRTRSGDEGRARVVVDAVRTLHRSMQPNYPGVKGFRGPSFHFSHWEEFDPAGKRVAVIGDRAAHVLPLLANSKVTLFECPPNRVPLRLRRHVAKSPIDGITDEDFDAIIYATGYAAVENLPHDALVGSRGLTIQQAWRDGASAYFGVAVHGFPNYFLLRGPDSPAIDEQMRYVVECLQRMQRKGSTRIEVRRSAQQQFTERARVKPPALAFDLATSDAQHEIYDVPATLSVGGDDHTVRVRLTGHLDPIDGKYHWQGTVFGTTAELPKRPVTLATDTLTADARITERTPWGSYSISGAGAPPYAR